MGLHQLLCDCLLMFAGKKKLEPPLAVREWYSQIGKLGGTSTSPVKLAAIAKNAKKGGWPKGTPRKVS